jgi:TonB-dependent receptor
VFLCAVLAAAAALLFFTPPARAQVARAPEPGTVEGTVYNATNGLPLARAKVALEGGAAETLTDEQGHFSLAGLPAGERRLEVSYLGFATQSTGVTVAPGGTAVRDFQLTLADAGGGTGRGAGGSEVVQMERFTVVADQAMSAQAIAINEQRHAANIMNVVAFEELGEQGHESIGNYIRYMPGVAVVGNSVALGGFPNTMTSISLDGGAVAATGEGIGAGSRTLKLDDTPMVNVERVEVSKVPLPDMPASGLGGSINIVTRSLLGIKKARFNWQMYMRFNNRDGLTLDGGPRQATPQASPKYNQPSFNLSLIQPLGHRLVLSLGASRTWGLRPTDNTPTEYAFWNLATQWPDLATTSPIALTRTQWIQSANVSTTENIEARLEYKLAAHDTLMVSAQRRNTTSVTSNYYVNHNYSQNNAAGIAAITGDGSRVQSQPNRGYWYLESSGNNEHFTRTDHLTLQYRHTGPKWRIDAKGFYSKADRHVNAGPGSNGAFSIVQAYSSPNAGGGDATPYYNLRGDGINSGSSIHPASVTITDTTGQPIAFDPYDSRNLYLQNCQFDYGRYRATLTSGRVDVERVFNSHFSLKAGAARNRLDKNDALHRDAYVFRDGTNLATRRIGAYDLVDESVDISMNGTRVVWISPVKTYDLFLAHPDWFTESNNNPLNESRYTKRMVEVVDAAYLRFDLRFFRNRLHIAGGARYEGTALDGWSLKQDGLAIYQRDEDGSLLRDLNGVLVQKKNPDGSALTQLQKNRLIYQALGYHESSDYDGLYPSLNASFAITPNLIIRAAYARTIGRPDISYVVDGITYPDPADTSPTTTRTITVGNPGLKPWTADSLHLSLDSYLLTGGYGSLGIYQKDVTNFFERRRITATADALDYYKIPEADRQLMIDNDYEISRWENIGDARLTGLEFNYRQTLFFLPAWFKKSQLWLNYTHLAVSGPNAADFTGFSPDVFSAGLNLIRPRCSLRLTCSYQAETKRSLDSPATGPTSTNPFPAGTYTYIGAYTSYKLTAEYALSRAFTLFADWNNIFAEDQIYYRRAAGTPAWASLSCRFVNPSSIMLGIKGSF